MTGRQSERDTYRHTDRHTQPARQNGTYIHTGTYTDIQRHT